METRRKCRAGQPRAGTDPTAAFVVHEKCLLLGNETLSVAKTAERRELSLQAAAGPGRAASCLRLHPATWAHAASLGRGGRRREASAGDSDARRRAPGAVWSAPHAHRRGSLRGGGGRRKVPRREAGAVESGRGSLLRRKRAPKLPPARRRVGLPAGPPPARPPSTSRLPPPTARLAHVAVPLPPAVTGPACPPPCSPAPTGQRAVTRPAPGPPPRRLPPPLAQISGTASLETY